MPSLCKGKEEIQVEVWKRILGQEFQVREEAVGLHSLPIFLF